MRHSNVIIGIDPGTNSAGVCIMQVTRHIDKLIVSDVEAKTISIGKNLSYDKQIEETHGFKYARLIAYENAFKIIFDIYKPEAIAIEAPFFNPRRPNAYAPLIEMMYVIHRAAFLYDKDLELHRYSPPMVKKAVGTNGKSSNKEDTRDKVLPILKSLNVYKPSHETLDEHSVDAIAVALTYISSLDVIKE